MKIIEIQQNQKSKPNNKITPRTSRNPTWESGL